MKFTAVHTLVAACLFAPTLAHPQQRDQLRERLDHAVAVLDSAEIERAVNLFRSIIGDFTSRTPADLRANVHTWIGEALWSLGLRDSAVAQFREAVKADVFSDADPNALNPEVIAAFESARRTTLALGFQVANDATVDPLTEEWPIRLAVGQPGRVAIRLTHLVAPTRDSMIGTLQVDGLANHDLSLLTGDSLAIEPGIYELSFMLESVEGAETHEFQFSVERIAVDTVPHEPLPDASLFRLEFRKGRPPTSSILRGLLFGAAAALIPSIVSNGDLRNGGVEAQAAIIGGSIALGGALGLSLGRPDLPIEENITHNRIVRSAWQNRNQVIADENAMRRRLAPLRLRVLSGSQQP